MNGIYQYFTKDELRCSCKECKDDEEVHMDPQFMELIIILRERCGFPFIVTSAYRCPKHPIEARKSSPGAHSSGKAMDIKADGKRAHKLLQEALDMGFLGIGVNQKGNHAQRFIHVDMDTSQPSRPWVWSY